MVNEKSSNLNGLDEERKRNIKKIYIAIGVIVLVGVLVSLFMFLKPGEIEGGKHFEDIDVIFFAGGIEGDLFATIVYNGAKAAEEDLGPNVEYVWSNWDVDTMTLQFKEAIDKSPDGIVMMGHPGESALKPLIDEAIRKGIIVSIANIDLPNIREDYIGQGMGYVGQEAYASGHMLGQGAARKYNLGEGDEATIIGYFDRIGAMALRAARAEGSARGLEEAGVTVHRIDIPLEMEEYGAEFRPKNLPDYESDLVFDYFTEQIDMYPNIKLLMADLDGGGTTAVAKHLKRMGKAPGELPYASVDLAPETVDLIKEGYIGLVLDQQPYLQGYLSILQICLTKKYEFSGLYIDTGVGLVDDSNIDNVAELVKNQIR